jgi:uncharacterized pyridoxal phosphate-containing UPF0001 family protein
VALVAVSKTFPADRVGELLACGHDLFGENRVQEALEKIPRVGPGARWHLVGHLQSNKARHAVGTFELIHSVDGLDLAREISRRAAASEASQIIIWASISTSAGPASTRTHASSGNRDVSALAVTSTGLPSPISRMVMPDVSPAAG